MDFQRRCVCKLLVASCLHSHLSTICPPSSAHASGFGGFRPANFLSRETDQQGYPTRPALNLTQTQTQTQTMPTYSIEHAKSGRATCKTKACSEKIAKDELRIGASAPGPGDYDVTKWYHPECFPFPRALKNAGETPETFVADTLEDNTTEGILSDPDKAAEVVALIKQKGRKKVDEETGEEVPQGADGAIEAIKRNLEIIQKEDADDDDDDDDDEPKKKKAKSDTSTSINEQDRAKAEIYSMFSGYKLDELKDILRWNHGMVGGKKAVLLTRIIDGKMNGRLGRCPTCLRGRVKLSEDDGGRTVYCNGFFDEDLNIRQSCFYKAPVADAPRMHPFFTEEPTEEEREEMDKEWEASKMGGTDNAADVDKATFEITKLVDDIDWDISTKDGMKKAANDVIDLCKGKVDIPEDESKARMAIGKVIAGNRTATPAEILELIIDQFGFAEIKEKQQKMKTEAAAAVCGHPGNVAVMEAINELSSLYFNEGNANAGGTYKKVAAALKDLDYKVTADNAKGLGKGKTKVANIGKGSAEKIHEFVTTGSMEKLEEKRAAA